MLINVYIACLCICVCMLHHQHMLIRVMCVLMFVRPVLRTAQDESGWRIVGSIPASGANGQAKQQGMLLVMSCHVMF